MRKHTFKRCAAALAACMMMASAMPVMTAPVMAAGNIIKNPDFESNTKGWGVYNETGGKYSLNTEDGKLALTVLNRGQVAYSVQLNQPTIKLYKNGVYRFKFDISSTVERYVEAMIQMDGGDYRSYTWKGIEISPETQTIDYEFVMEEETDIMSKLCFNCGVEKQDPADLPEHTIYLDNVSLELVDDSNVDYSATQAYEIPININQLGYKTDSKKIAVIRGEAGTTASVVNADTKEKVYTGNVGAAITNTSANETNYQFDFSSVTTPGKYYIECDGITDPSYTFTIGDNPYGNLLDDSVRMLYLQRCGTEVVDEKFGHKACHTSTATIYGTNETIDVSGGWHDAGDYGRYIVAAAKAVADVLYAYQADPTAYSDNIGIPESGNGTPDVLDEVRYELEWMLKMQASDGGVYHKVSCDTFPGYIMPEKETKPLIVMPKSTTATADFAASMAMAYEFYKDIDAAFANKCLEAAKKAYEWAKANPSVTYTNPADVVTGEYGDRNPKDELYWAAAQMYRATGESSYLPDAEAVADKLKSGLDWSTVGDYGNIALLTMDGIDKNSSAYTKAKSLVVAQADELAEIASEQAYGVATESYHWGSNMTIANYGIILAQAYKLTGEQKYLDAAQGQLDYLLGVNPLGTCFVTGYGTVSPLAPHHRPSMAVGSAMKGMLVGGVNQNLEDNAALAYCADSPPAKCFIDNSESYSTNEITIYWNSPLTYLMSMTADSSSELPEITPPDGNVLWGDANADGMVNLADAILIMQVKANPTKYSISAAGERAADVNLCGNGITNADALSIQKYLLGLVSKLPESYDTTQNTTTTTRTTTTTTTSSRPTVTTTTSNVLGIKDYGTPMNSNATAVEDFRDGSSKLFFASDGWENGDPFDCGWYEKNTSLDKGCLTLTIDKDYSGKYNYSGAEYRTSDHYGYGYYETSMQAIKNDGVVSSFFTYTGPSEDNPWDEIDIEILGKDTTKVQLNYYTNGVGNHEVMYDLGFDASQGFHTYGFDWQPDHITWYIDGKAVYTAYSNIPKTPSRIMMNTWPGRGVNEWLNAYNGKTPLTAYYQWVTYDSNGPHHK